MGVKPHVCAMCRLTSVPYLLSLLPQQISSISTIISSIISNNFIFCIHVGFSLGCIQIQTTICPRSVILRHISSTNRQKK